jgi:hypothetical protein
MTAIQENHSDRVTALLREERSLDDSLSVLLDRGIRPTDLVSILEGLETYISDYRTDDELVAVKDGWGEGLTPPKYDQVVRHLVHDKKMHLQEALLTLIFDGEEYSAVLAWWRNKVNDLYGRSTLKLSTE